MQQHRCSGGVDLVDKGTVRALAILAFGCFTTGMAVVIHGIITDNAARSAAGASLSITSLTFFALCQVKKWITCTEHERDRQLDAARASNDERTKYIAAQAAMQIERQRMQRDAAAERRQLAARLATEQAAMRARFQEERDTLVCETVEATLRMVREEGLLDNQAPEAHAKVIGLFPEPCPARQREPAPTRDRGATRS